MLHHQELYAKLNKSNLMPQNNNEFKFKHTSIITILFYD